MANVRIDESTHQMVKDVVANHRATPIDMETTIGRVIGQLVYREWRKVATTDQRWAMSNKQDLEETLEINDAVDDFHDNPDRYEGLPEALRPEVV